MITIHEHDRRVYPVIHHLNYATTLEQAKLAFECGADGVFLISHNGRNNELFPAASAIKRDFPEKAVGLNLLGVSASEAYAQVLAANLDMMWTDVPGVTSQGVDAEGKRLMLKLVTRDRTPLVFGSVAFKYQPPESDPAGAAMEAARLEMIPTTSGAATGRAPEESKIRAMAAALAGGQFAVASGMTPDNVDTYLPYVTEYLVATGVSTGMHHFDPFKLRDFITKVHAYKDPAAKAKDVDWLRRAFNMLSDEYIKFDRVPQARRLHPRADLCCFLLLERLSPGEPGTDLICGAGHDTIFLDVDLAKLAKSATVEDVRTLVRCGVRLTGDGLEMFV